MLLVSLIIDCITDSDCHINVRQTPDAVVDNVTGSIMYEVKCGPFQFKSDSPPFSIEWKVKLNFKHSFRSVCTAATYSSKYCLYKIARPQESQSFTAYTISKEQYDS